MITILKFVHAFCFAITVFLSMTLRVTGAAAAQETNGQHPKPIQRQTKAFRLEIHSASNELADKTVGVAEKTWEVAADLYGAEIPNTPLMASLYRDNAGYEAAEQKLTKGAFKRNLAFAHYDSLSAHVAIQPPLTDEGLKDVGMPKLTARMLAHEMAHLVRYHHMPNSFRNHPEWFVHGMASYIDKQVIRELGYVGDPMQDPDNGQNIFQAKRLLETGKLPAVATLLKDEDLKLNFYEGYSVRWIFLDMLMTKYETEFRAFLKDVRRLGGGSGFADRVSKMLVDKLDVSIDQLETDFRGHVEGLKPVWVDFVRSLETSGETWHQIAFPDANALAWQQTPLPKSASVSVEATFLNGSNRQLNMRLGLPNRFTQFSITAGFGMNLFQYADGKWNMVEKKEIPDLKIGQPMRIELVHDPKSETVEFELDGEPIYQGKLSLEKDDRLGLSAQKGSIVAWKNLQVTGDIDRQK